MSNKTPPTLFDKFEDESRQMLTVTQLNARIKLALQEAFPDVWVSGEISDLARPHSGHVYFSLKDETAQLRAVLWRNAARRLTFDLDDGMEVICRGEIDVYSPRGSYQLVVREVEPRGVGALQLALEKLRKALTAEGLFEPAHKQPLPRFPRRIAVVTSPTGAAIRDFLEVVRRRYPGVHILVIPTRVQGKGAGVEVAAAVRTANALRPPPDVLVVTRGGGSLEDLWCFNEEPLVREIFASRVPVVSAIGHEIDVTLSDLVADVRALTPSEAAERVVPANEDLRAALRVLGRRLGTSLAARVRQARSRLEALAARPVFRKPQERVHELARRVDELESRATRAARMRCQRAADQLRSLAARLESLSPLAVLGRGYSLTQKTRDGQFVSDAGELSVGETIRSRLARGAVVSRVEELEHGKEEGA
jgi:exodeoxyribonuclease VII large subunit